MCFSQNENAKYIEIQVEQQYKNLIEAGDKLMTETKYAQAEVKYYNALQLLPKKIYAKSQHILLINRTPYTILLDM